MDEDHAYESVEEMARASRRNVGFFHLCGIVPHAEIWVKGKRNQAFQRSAIFVPESSDRANDLFLEAKELLLAHQRKSRTFLIKTTVVVGALLLLVGLFFKDMLPGKSHLATALWNLGVLAIITLTFFGSYGMGQYISSINLEYRTEQISFWAKNKDDVLKVIIGAVVGAVLTLIGEWVRSRYLSGRS